MERSLYCLCLLSVVLCFAEANNPGFKARITAKGLKYANDVAIRFLADSVRNFQFPKMDGNGVVIKGVYVKEFNPPRSDMSIASNRGLNWKATNAYIKVSGSFSYNVWWFIWASGSFDAAIHEIDYNLGINIGKDANFRPTISSRHCYSSTGSVDFRFRGGLSWVYNFFRHKAGGFLKNWMDENMCKIANKLINENAASLLAQLPVSIAILDTFLLDYSLERTPLFTPGYMETYHKGEFLWQKTPTTDASLVAPVMGKLAGAPNKMFYIWLSDYMFDTLGSVAQKHGLLMHNLIAKELPEVTRDLLNTTCPRRASCMGRLVPQIGRKYPNSQVELRLASGSPPAMKVSPSGVAIECSGTIDIYARLPGKTETPFLFSLDATMFATANVSIRNERINAKIDQLSFKLEQANSTVGEIPLSVINRQIEQTLTTFLTPQLNDLGVTGMPIPTIGEVQFVGPQIVFVEDAVIIGTDLKYTPGRELP